MNNTNNVLVGTVAIIVLGMAYAMHSLILGGSPVSDLLSRGFWAIFGGV